MANYNQDSQNPLDVAANKIFTPDNRKTPTPFNEANPIQVDPLRKDMPMNADIDLDNKDNRDKIDKIMMAQNKNKLLAMNGDTPMSSESWLYQAYQNLIRNFKQRMKNAQDVESQYDVVQNDMPFYMKGKEVAENIRKNSKSPTGNYDNNEGRGIPPNQV